MLVKVAPSRSAGDGLWVHAARCRCRRAFAIYTAYVHVQRGADAPFALDDQASRSSTLLSSATALHPPRSSRRSQDVPEGAGAVLLDHDRGHDAETSVRELRDKASATGLQATGGPQCITSTVAASATRERANAQAAGGRYCLPCQRVRARDMHAPSCLPPKDSSFSRDSPDAHESDCRVSFHPHMQRLEC